MKLLLIAGFAGSLVNFRGPLISAFQTKGFEVHVAAPDLFFNSSDRIKLESLGLIVHNVKMQRTGMNPLSDLNTLFSLWRLMSSIKPHIVLGYTVKPVIYGSIAAWFAGVPNRFALITGLGYAFQSTSAKNGLRSLVKKLYSVALSKVNKVFFQNPDDEKLFRDMGILRKEAASCVVNGSGVDTNYFFHQPLPSGAPRFLLIARLLGDKGIREYAAAAARVREKHPEIRFLLVGWLDDNPNSISKKELDNWVNNGQIEYLGRHSDVRPVITESSVYVLPSYREGTPRTVLEAMSMGRAIITTDAPGCRETVINEDNGFLVPVKSVDALEAAMLKFIHNPDLCEKMGLRSRQIAEFKYDVHKVNEVMLSEMNIK